MRRRSSTWWRRCCGVGMRLARWGALGILRRLIARVSDAFPKAKLRVRLDGGFASPEVLDFLDCEPKVEYLVNMAANAVLKRKAESADRKSTRLNSSHSQISYAVFCLKKKKKKNEI